MGELNPYALVCIISCVLAAVVSTTAWQRRAVPGSVPLAALMAVVAIWAISAAFESMPPQASTRIFWSKVEYLGVATSSVFFFLFALEYARFGKWITRRRVALLFVIPVITLLLAATNEWHGLLWGHFTWDSSHGMLLLLYGRGPWFWVNVLYAYLTLSAGAILVARSLIAFPLAHAAQAAAVGVGAILPFMGSILYVTPLNPIPGIDWTPAAFAFTGIALTYGLFRFQLLDLVPIARGALIENMTDGILILDERDRIVDVNPAAQTFVGDKRSLIGQSARTALARWPELALPSYAAVTDRVEIQTGPDGPFWEATRSPLYHHQVLSGRLIVLRDITERKAWERAEHEQRVLAEALRDAASTMNRSLDLNEVLDNILEQVGRVITFDGVAIFLVEGDLVVPARWRGRIGPSLARSHINLGTTANLRRMADTGRPVVVSDTYQYPGWVRLPLAEWVRSNAGAPLCYRDQVIGFLLVDSATPGFYQTSDGERLQVFADQAAVAIENARLFAEAQLRAMQDELTGVYNRRGLTHWGEREVDRALRFGRPLGLVMLDLDNFKMANDTYGHSVGDRVLRAVAACCLANVRNVDIVCRYGGEEFVLLLLESDLTTSLAAAERLRARIAELRVPIEQGEITVTGSLGVATLLPSTDTLAALIQRADQAQYRAKQRGRNRVEVLDEIDTPSHPAPI